VHVEVMKYDLGDLPSGTPVGCLQVHRYTMSKQSGTVHWYTMSKQLGNGTPVQYEQTVRGRHTGTL